MAGADYSTLSCRAAADITVDGTVCTLEEAITSANNDSAAGNGCVDGSSADTITLQTDVTLAAALPEISSTITIEGSGHFINGNKNEAVIRVLTIKSGGNLTMNETVVKDGYTRTGCGGGIYNIGTVTLTNSTVSGNTAYVYSSSSHISSYGGGIYNSGTVTLINSTVSGNLSASHNYYCSSYPASCYSPGGGIYNNFGTVTLQSSIISGNTGDLGTDEIYNIVGAVTADHFNVLGCSSKTSAHAFYGLTLGSSDVNAATDRTCRHPQHCLG